MDNRRIPTDSQVVYFKQRAAAYQKNTSVSGKLSAANDMDYYLKQYQGLDEYDPRTNGMNKNDDTKNYIEVKMGGLTLRKQGDRLSIKGDVNLEYTDANIAMFNKQLAGGLDVIATAAKLDGGTTAAGVSI